jgi:hypothetical protein
VGLMTGDVSVNPNSNCVVMTTEILRSMIYRCVADPCGVDGLMPALWLKPLPVARRQSLRANVPTKLVKPLFVQLRLRCKPYGLALCCRDLLQ